MCVTAAAEAVAAIVATYQPARLDPAPAQLGQPPADGVGDGEYELCRVLAVHASSAGGEAESPCPSAACSTSVPPCNVVQMLGAKPASGRKLRGDAEAQLLHPGLVKGGPGLVKALLGGLNESARQFEEATRVEESSHPMMGETDTNLKAMTMPGDESAGLCVMFDQRCHLSGGQKLQLFLDPECTDLVATCTGKGYAAFAPLILPTNSLYVRVSGSSMEPCWGYRMMLSPLGMVGVGVVDWACRTSLLRPHLLSASDWSSLVSGLLSFLSTVKKPCPVRIDAARALIRILRSSCQHVGRMIGRQPTAASAVSPADEESNIQEDSMVRAVVEQVGAYALNEMRGRISKESEAGCAHSVMLQVMVELVAACAVLSCEFAPGPGPEAHDAAGGKAVCSAPAAADLQNANGQGPLAFPAIGEVEHGQLLDLQRLVEEEGLDRRPLVLEPLPADQPAGEEMAVVVALALDALCKGTPMGPRLDSLLCEAWLALRSPYSVHESKKHPYPKDTEEAGSVSFPGAVRLRVLMDARCATDSDDFLELYRPDAEEVRQAQGEAPPQAPRADQRVARFSGPFGVARGGLDARASAVVEGDALVYKFTGKRGSNWGYRFTVVPEYAAKDRRAALARDEPLLEQAVAGMLLCTPELDRALVNLVNRQTLEWGPGTVSCPVWVFMPDGFDMSTLSSPAPVCRDWAHDTPPRPAGSGCDGGLGWPEQRAGSGCDGGLGWPGLADTGRFVPGAAGPATGDKLPVALVRFRLAMLLVLNNTLLHPLMCLVDLSLVHLPGTLAHTLSVWRGLLCHDVKHSHLERCLHFTTTTQEKLLVVLDRRAHRPVMEQLQAQVGGIHASRLRHPDMAFLVQFVGEGAEGFNGPYRECMSTVCEELESSRLPLLALCPNGAAGGTAPNQDKFIPRPSVDSPACLSAFRLLGRILGISVWTTLRLDLHMPPSFWKYLVGQVLLDFALSCRLPVRCSCHLNADCHALPLTTIRLWTQKT